MPGTTLKLPDSATYTIASGDTLDAIAAKHGLTASAIQALNTELLAAQKYTDTTKPLEFERRLTLPDTAEVIVKAGDTIGTIATAHGMTPDKLQEINQLTATSVLTPGQHLKLLAQTRYIVQQGDSLKSIADAHGITVADLKAANKPVPTEGDTDLLNPNVVLKLPPVDAFKVEGQTLEDIANTFSGVTADSLAKANGVDAKAVLRVGTKLNVPLDAWGSAPPDTINPGTACVEHAVPNSVFQQILPGSPTATVTAPAQVSNTVAVEAHADDYTVTADGTAQPANKWRRLGEGWEFRDVPQRPGPSHHHGERREAGCKLHAG